MTQTCFCDPRIASLELLRAHASGDADRIEMIQTELANCPGRAAGRVAAWSMSRTFEALRRFSRRPVRLGEIGSEPTPHEISILNVLDRVAADDRTGAEQAATWLVTPQGVDALISRLAPAARSLGLQRRAA